MALHRTAVCNVWNRKGNVFRGMYNLGCAKNTPRASSCKKCDWLHLKTCSCENIQSGWCENTGSNLHIFTDFEQDLLFLLEVKVVDWRMYYGNDKALWGNWLIKYSGVCVCVSWGCVWFHHFVVSYSCRSSLTQTSPVATSCSRRRRFAAPLLSISFFMVATGTSVRPRKSERKRQRSVI